VLTSSARFASTIALGPLGIRIRRNLTRPLVSVHEMAASSLPEERVVLVDAAARRHPDERD
jgi:hypothetical protein